MMSKPCMMLWRGLMLLPPLSQDSVTKTKTQRFCVHHKRFSVQREGDLLNLLCSLKHLSLFTLAIKLLDVPLCSQDCPPQTACPLFGAEHRVHSWHLDFLATSSNVLPVCHFMYKYLFVSILPIKNHILVDAVLVVAVIVIFRSKTAVLDD